MCTDTLFLFHFLLQMCYTFYRFMRGVQCLNRVLKGSSDAHFPQVDMILYGLNEKSITYFGLISQW